MDGDIGDLMVLPKSQYSMWDPSALGQIFKDTPLPGGKVFDDMPNGTAVICHSGLVHGRRQKPGGEDHPRYFVDVSYCQPGDFVTNNRMGRKQVRVSTHSALHVCFLDLFCGYLGLILNGEQAELELAMEKNLHREYMFLCMSRHDRLYAYTTKDVVSFQSAAIQA